jgi:hypothetical protein
MSWWAGLRVVQQVAEQVPEVAVVGRHLDGPQPRCAQPGLVGHEGVGQHRDDRVARRHADAAQGVGPGAEAIVELAEGALPTLDVEHGELVGHVLGVAGDQVREHL